jgi:hypothetical protein
MHPVWWFLIIAAAVIFVTAPWKALRDDRFSSRSRKLAMRRRLQRFEAQERVHQQAATMRRVREINAMAHETCQAMLQAALEAQSEELNDHAEQPSSSFYNGG